MPEVTIASCSFTGSAGTDIRDLTPETGSAFARHSSFSSNAMLVTDANRARNGGGATDVALYYNQTTPTNADYKVGTTYRKLSTVSGAYAGIAGRLQSGAFSLYMVSQQSVGTWELAKIVAGVYTALGTYSGTPTIGQDYTLELQFSGTSIKFLLDGVERISATDSAISAKGYGGVVTYKGVTNSTGEHLDTFYVKEDQAAHPAGTEAVTLSAAGFQLSPFNWRVSGNSRITIYPGAYLKRSVKTTYLALNLDVSALTGASVAANRYPKLLFRVDDGEWEEHQIQSSPTFHVVFDGLSNAFHDVDIRVLASDAFTARWNETSAVKISSVQMDTGWESADVDEPTDTMLSFGNSITEGAGMLGAATNGAEYVLYASSIDSYAAHIAEALGARDCRSALGGTGWDSTWNGDVPSFPNTWDKYSSGNSRLSAGLLSPDPTWILVNMGTNGGLASSTTLADWLADVRAAAPTAKIVVLVPFGQNAVSNITAGFNAYQTASPDSRCKLIDLGAIEGVGPTIATATYRTTDGLHPDKREHARLGAVIAAAIREAFTTGGGLFTGVI